MGEVIEFRRKSPEERLRSLPNHGFKPEQYEQAIDIITASGLPTDNITALERKPNDPDDEDNRRTVAQMGIVPENLGVMTVFDLIDELPPEQQAGAFPHEIYHSITPNRKDNARLYGGEAKREEAQLYGLQLAEQSLRSNRFLNGYQAYLAEKLSKGEEGYDFGLFVEETLAIATELGLTNRAKLEQVEAAQHKTIANLQKTGQIPQNFEPVNLISHGEEPDGIDRQLVMLIDGVSNADELTDHVANLKEHFYSDKNLELAEQRSEQQGVSIDIPIRRRVGGLALAA